MRCNALRALPRKCRHLLERDAKHAQTLPCTPGVATRVHTLSNLERDAKQALIASLRVVTRILCCRKYDAVEWQAKDARAASAPGEQIAPHACATVVATTATSNLLGDETTVGRGEKTWKLAFADGTLYFGH